MPHKLCFKVETVPALVEVTVMRVLIVEDDSATARTVDAILRAEGFVCDTTYLGEDGLEIGKLYD